MPPPRYPPAKKPSPYGPAPGKYTPTPKPDRAPIPKPKKAKKVAPTKVRKAPLPAVTRVAPPPPSPLDQLVQMYAAQQADLQRQQQGQQQSLTDFSKQMLQYLTQQPGAINALYQHAVDQTNAFGQTAADQFRAANPNAQVQGDLNAIGAGPEQAQKVGGELNSIYGTGGATLYAAGGQIPATELAANQASAGLYANSLPGIQALQARQLFAQLLANQAKDTSALSSDKTKALYDAQGAGGGTAAGAPTTKNFIDGTTREYNPATGKWVVVARKAGAAGKPVKLSYTKDPAGNIFVFNPLTGKTTLANPPGWTPKPSSGGTLKYSTDKAGRPYTIVNGKVVLLPVPPGFTLHAPGAGGSGGGGSGGGGGSAGLGAPGQAVIFKTASGAAAYARTQTANGNTLWKVRNRRGGVEAYDTGKIKAGGAAGAPGTIGTNPSGGKLYPEGTAYAVLNTLSLKSQGTAISKWKGKAQLIAVNAFKGNPAAGTPKHTYQYALAFAIDQGIPLDIAQKALNRYWRKPGDETNSKKPGEGRPLQSLQQRTGKGKAANAAYTIHYTGGGGPSLVQLLQAAGFSGEGLRIAYGIALRESGGNPQAFNGNAGTGDRSWGLFQINTLGNLRSRVKKFGLSSEQDLLDPLANARAAYQMSKGGTDFGAWGIGPSAYRSGAGFDTIRQYYDQFPGYV